MNISCEIIQDLLPLYAEKMTSKASDSLIEAHLAECKRCKRTLDGMMSDLSMHRTSVEKNPSLKFVQSGIKKRRRTTVFFAALLVFLAAFTVFSYLTRPSYVSYLNSGITITETHNGAVYADFSENVTAYRIMEYTTPDNEVALEIEAWTSVWDKILGKSTPSAFLTTAGSDVSTVYYCDCTATQDNLIVVYGTNPHADGGVSALPRLVMGYYFALALGAAAVLGVLTILLRKKQKAGVVCKYFFFAPVSYMLAHLLLSVKFASFSAARDFLMTLVAAAAIYGILLLGSSMLAQAKRDRLH